MIVLRQKIFRKLPGGKKLGGFIRKILNPKTGKKVGSQTPAKNPLAVENNVKPAGGGTGGAITQTQQPTFTTQTPNNPYTIAGNSGTAITAGGTATSTSLPTFEHTPVKNPVTSTGGTGIQDKWGIAGNKADYSLSGSAGGIKTKDAKWGVGGNKADYSSYGTGNNKFANKNPATTTETKATQTPATQPQNPATTTEAAVKQAPATQSQNPMNPLVPTGQVPPAGGAQTPNNPATGGKTNVKTKDKSGVQGNKSDGGYGKSEKSGSKDEPGWWSQNWKSVVGYGGGAAVLGGGLAYGSEALNALKGNMGNGDGY